MVSLGEVGEESLADWKALVDLGDHVFVSGEVISSRRGELSILVDATGGSRRRRCCRCRTCTPS